MSLAACKIKICRCYAASALAEAEAEATEAYDTAVTAAIEHVKACAANEDTVPLGEMFRDELTKLLRKIPDAMARDLVRELFTIDTHRLDAADAEFICALEL